jgi:hypothetical protein
VKKRPCKLRILHLRLLQLIFRGHPVPLCYWIALRSIAKHIFHSRNFLFPPLELLQNTGAQLEVSELQALLWNDELGMASLDKSVIERLWCLIQQERPNCVIECGSGISTVVLAKYASLAHSQGACPPRILSFEQDRQIQEGVESRLAECELGDYVKILYAPLSAEGKYKFDVNILSSLLGAEKADYLLIDGPFGPEGCRRWTIPLLARFCRPGAKWFLDDAFRDGELQVLRTWAHLPGLTVKGIFPIGKGLGTGIVKNPQLLASAEHLLK